MRKKLVTIALVLGAIAVGATAWAWYAGSGSANGAVAKGGHAPLTATVSIADGSSTYIYPGDSVPFTFQVSNEGQHQLHVGGIALDSAYGSNGISVSGDPGCLSSWFAVSSVAFDTPANGGLPANGIIAPGSGYSGSGTLQFSDQPLDQSACSDAVISVGVVTTP